MPQSPKNPQRLIALFIAGLVLLNFPLLAIFAQPLRAGGMPALALYLFAIWLLLVLLVAWLNRARH